MCNKICNTCILRHETYDNVCGECYQYNHYQPEKISKEANLDYFIAARPEDREFEFICELPEGYEGCKIASSSFEKKIYITHPDKPPLEINLTTKTVTKILLDEWFNL